MERERGMVVVKEKEVLKLRARGQSTNCILGSREAFNRKVGHITMPMLGHSRTLINMSDPTMEDSREHPMKIKALNVAQRRPTSCTPFRGPFPHHFALPFYLD